MDNPTKKFYWWGILVNLIPILVVFIISSDCSGDGCLGLFFIWFTLPIWAIIYLAYIVEDAEVNFFRTLKIFAPSILPVLFATILTIVEDAELQDTLIYFSILILPTFLFNVFVYTRVNKSRFNSTKKILNGVFMPILVAVLFFIVVGLFYTPMQKKYNYKICSIALNCQLTEFENYLHDSLANAYKLPDDFEGDLGIWWPNSFRSKDDYLLYFNDEMQEEVIQIEIVDNKMGHQVKIHGIWDCKKCKWKRNFKYEDEDAERAYEKVKMVLEKFYDNGEIYYVVGHTILK